MNARVLELLKNPDQILSQDLKILREEIEKYPYAQYLRALNLLGTHRFETENYQEELSKTAAYTTDKKILYRLINQVKEETVTPNSAAHITPENIEAAGSFAEREKPFTSVEVVEPQMPKQVFVNGELNRILFEGEEDFLDRKADAIDLESTLESGQLVVEKKSAADVEEKISQLESEIQPEEKQELTENENNLFESVLKTEFEDSEAVVEGKMDSIAEKVAVAQESEEDEKEEPKSVVEENEEPENEEHSSDLSFHGMEDFMPEVKIAAPQPEQNFAEPKPAVNRHEEEMKRLIAEVEAKMKANRKATPEKTEDIPTTDEINFAETHDSSSIIKSEEKQQEEITETKLSEERNLTEEQPVEIEKPTEKVSEKSAWKPMNFASSTPDSLLQKEISSTEISKVKESQTVLKDRETVTEEVAAVKTDAKTVQKQEETSQQEESNVPKFINTWQTWLKIDRTSAEKVKPELEKPQITDEPDVVEISEAETKNKAIDEFIEKEPKISKLKEDQQFSVREKTDDISHLMTETLAKLYVEQKLYSKAIKAYETLSVKHPEKKKQFKERISEIKELRQNK